MSSGKFAESRCHVCGSIPMPHAMKALLDARALLREIKQNIDANGPDRPDLYARLVAAVGEK